MVLHARQLLQLHYRRSLRGRTRKSHHRIDFLADDDPHGVHSDGAGVGLEILQLRLQPESRRQNSGKAAAQQDDAWQGGDVANAVGTEVEKIVTVIIRFCTRGTLTDACCRYTCLLSGIVRQFQQQSTSKYFFIISGGFRSSHHFGKNYAETATRFRLSTRPRNKEAALDGALNVQRHQSFEQNPAGELERRSQPPSTALRPRHN